MNIKEKKWFRLYESCILVNGYHTDLIYDIENSVFYQIPHDISSILGDTFRLPVSELLLKFNDGVSSLFEKFAEMGLGFFTNYPDLFPRINLHWDSPFPILNSVIEVENCSLLWIEKVIHQLSKLSCRAIQIRVLEPLSPADLVEFIISKVGSSRINQIEVYIPYQENLDTKFLFSILARENRVTRIAIYNSPQNVVISDMEQITNDKLFFYSDNLTRDSKEIINISRFYTNIKMFSESQNHNIGLNRKISIRYNGEIKNYISHEKSFGNIKDTLLQDVFPTEEFQEKWFISNDKIEICKLCQYRYACTSNSDIVKSGGKYYKTEMCAFDPINNKWNN